jgi:hypothetical protein
MNYVYIYYFNLTRSWSQNFKYWLQVRPKVLAPCGFSSGPATLVVKRWWYVNGDVKIDRLEIQRRSLKSRSMLVLSKR